MSAQIQTVQDAMIKKTGEGIFGRVHGLLQSISGYTTLILAAGCVGLFFVIKYLYSYFTRDCDMEGFLGSNRKTLNSDNAYTFRASDVADNLREHLKNTQLPYGMRCLKKCEKFP